MPWQEIFVFLNTVDTFAGLVFALAAWLGFRAWRRSRAQAGQDTVGAAGSEDPQADEVAW